MSIKVVPYTDPCVPAVAAFNRRMFEGNTGWGWYESAEDNWIPPRDDATVWREHYLAIDDEDEVRAAYALKPQQWYVRGEQLVVADWQGPVSEGLLSRRYATLGLRLIRDMLKKQPLLYSWGHGGHESAMLQLLVSLKWLIHPTPFLLKVRRPHAFLRRNTYLRSSVRNRLALDALAWSGAGWLGLKTIHGTLGLRAPQLTDFEIEEMPRFGPWADELWAHAHPQYAALGLRDARTMNRLVPEQGWPNGIRLRVTLDGQEIGWAVVLDNRLEADPRFGNLRVGCLADCFAAPEHAAVIVALATRYLEQRGVDMIGTNLSHPAWIGGCLRSGFLAVHDRRSFAASPELHNALGPFDDTRSGLHLTNMDGHGPHGF